MILNTQPMNVCSNGECVRQHKCQHAPCRAVETVDVIQALERKWAQRIRDYRQWYTSQDPLAPEDEGREVEFAFGDGWALGYDAALRPVVDEEVRGLVERLTSIADDMHRAIAGGMSWISYDEEVEFERRIRKVAADLIERLAAFPTVGEKPLAYLHTLHMEGGQTYERLLNHDGRFDDEPRRTAFGIPGRDYSEEYEVTTTPLFAASGGGG